MPAKPEKVEEKKFVAKVEAHGWDCIKLSTQGPYGRTGRNDRLVLAMYGVVALFEFKAGEEDSETREEAAKLQDFYHRRLHSLGHKTYVVYKASEAYQTLLNLIQEAKGKAGRS